MTGRPTVEDPREVNVHGRRAHGHAYVYVTGGFWRIEHCQDGHWGACGLLIFGASDDERAVERAVLRHLSRKSHNFEFDQRLAGTHHAGGGAVPYIKGPKR